MAELFKSRSYLSRGVALLMVLAGLAVLSAIVVEFAYNSNVAYNLAVNEADRVQAYHLAQSAMNFSKLVIKYDKETKKLAGEASKKLGKTVQVQPLYEMIPIDTAMIRGLAGLSEDAQQSEEEASVPEAGQEEGTLQEGGLAFISLEGAKEFLAFRGDFSSEITEEESKLNLNIFYGMDPKQKKYDEWKGVLYHLLATDEFAGLFEDRYRDAKEMAQSIVDYIDKDDVYNETGGEQRGREGAAGQQYQEMKNAKLLSVEELMMVPGMTEGVFQKLKEMVTVYGNSEKVYICRAKEPLVKALIIMYTDIHPQIEPLQDDNTELLDKALEAVLNSCPDTVLLAQELDKVLGVVESTEDGGTSTTSTTSLQGKKSPVEGGEPGSSITNFQDMLTDEANIFTIVAKGIVGESEVKLKTILDTSGGDPKQWQELYWRVE